MCDSISLVQKKLPLFRHTRPVQLCAFFSLFNSYGLRNHYTKFNLFTQFTYLHVYRIVDIRTSDRHGGSFFQCVTVILVRLEMEYKSSCPVRATFSNHSLTLYRPRGISCFSCNTSNFIYLSCDQLFKTERL